MKIEWATFNLRMTSLLFTVVLFAGCAGDKVMVIRETKSDTASFTVIPAMVIPANLLGAYKVIDTSNEDMEFAARIEREIAGFGLKVYERPPFRFLETTSTSQSAPDQRGKEDSSAQSKATTIDFVSMYPDATSDFIVVTYRSSGRVRIIRKQDKSLVATFTVDIDNNQPEETTNRIYSALVYAGLVKKAQFSSCKLLERIPNRP
jgi:hypothetical protein